MICRICKENFFDSFIFISSQNINPNVFFKSKQKLWQHFNKPIQRKSKKQNKKVIKYEILTWLMSPNTKWSISRSLFTLHIALAKVLETVQSEVVSKNKSTLLSLPGRFSLMCMYMCNVVQSITSDIFWGYRPEQLWINLQPCRPVSRDMRPQEDSKNRKELKSANLWHKSQDF